MLADGSSFNAELPATQLFCEPPVDQHTSDRQDETPGAHEQALGGRIDSAVDQEAGDTGADGRSDHHDSRGKRPDGSEVPGPVGNREQHAPRR